VNFVVKYNKNSLRVYIPPKLYNFYYFPVKFAFNPIWYFCY